MNLRIAPSPTGLLHIGNLRAAVFNWVMARKKGGKFYVRIEDTDKERSQSLYERDIFDTLAWMKLDYDFFEDPPIVRQSERKDLYKHYAKQLQEKGDAYYCICETLPDDKQKCDCRNRNYTSGVLRYKVPCDGHTSFTDGVFGFSTYPNKDLEDFALLRSNEDPTYMLAVVIDDHFMEITDVIRGEDHKTNTFKQIFLYESFAWPIPKFFHLPMIKGPDGKKLSKRNGDTSVKSYRDKGILPEALFSSLLKLGWGYKNEEIFTQERALEIFDISAVGRAPCFFDSKKLEKLSGFFLRQLDKKNEIKEIVRNMYSTEDFFPVDFLYEELRKRANTLQECAEQLDFYYYWKGCDFDLEQTILQELYDFLSVDFALENFSHGISVAAMILRKALTNRVVTPNITLIMNCLGKEECLRRLEIILKKPS